MLFGPRSRSLPPPPRRLRLEHLEDKVLPSGLLLGDSDPVPDPTPPPPDDPAAVSPPAEPPAGPYPLPEPPPALPAVMPVEPPAPEPAAGPWPLPDPGLSTAPGDDDGDEEAQPPAAGAWQQITGPRDGALTETIFSDSKLRDVTITRQVPSATSPNLTTITEQYTVREIVTARLGYRSRPGAANFTIYNAGTFRLPIVYNTGWGFEKVRSSSVEVGITGGVAAAATISPALSFSVNFEQTVTVGTGQASAIFHYWEAAVRIAETDEQGNDSPMKGKDVKVVDLLPFVEVTRRYELVRANGSDVAAEQIASREGRLVTNADRELMYDARLRQGDIVAGWSATLTAPGSTRYWKGGIPQIAVYVRGLVPAVPKNAGELPENLSDDDTQ